MIQHINERRHANVITIEDPIEFLHRDLNSHINQREVGTDTDNFAQALRRVLRQDPDVVLIGEIRDRETAGIAVQTSLTGHLVFSTLHTIDASKTVERIVGTFEVSDQQAVRSRLAASFRYFISQRYRVGAVTLGPQMSIDAGERQAQSVEPGQVGVADHVERGPLAAPPPRPGVVVRRDRRRVRRGRLPR